MNIAELGALVMTAPVHNAYTENKATESAINDAVKRYLSKDWGEVDTEDAAENDAALEGGGRIVARYPTPSGDIYIITEADRIATTIFFCEEY